jgi:hypothetical protein
MSLPEIGQYIVEQAEFSPETHCILGWFTSADVRVFRRALLSSPDIFDTTPSHEISKLRSSKGLKSLQPFNLATILRAYSDLTSVAVGYTHRSLFGQHGDYGWHLLKYDYLGIAEILR